MKHNLEEFKANGGFTENLTIGRPEARAASSREDGAPSCPGCGKPMIKRTAKRGGKSGSQFWSCSDYPNCTATLPL